MRGQALTPLLIFVPLAWIAHFLREDWGNKTVFARKYVPDTYQVRLRSDTKV